MTFPNTDTEAVAEAFMVLSVGVGPEASRIRQALRRRTLGCTACGEDVFDFEDLLEFRDAAGCHLCVPCFQAAGLENEHADGMHDGAAVEGCEVCRGAGE